MGKKTKQKSYSLEEMLTENYGEKGTASREEAEKKISKIASKLVAKNKAHAQKDATNDFQTPPEVCKYMASLMPVKKIADNKKQGGVMHLLEPTKGMGNLSKAMLSELKKSPYKYILHEPKDFFKLDRKVFDCIVLNPPFSEKSAFGIPSNLDLKGMRLGYHILTECMKMSDNVIALMPWFTLSDSDVRMRFFKNWGIKSLTALPRKTFQYARIQTVIIELQKGWDKETIFKTFEF